MPGNETDDAFADSILARIDTQVLDSLSPTQVDAIRQAIGRGHYRSRHPIDIRGVIPLFFMRLYYVFLVGRDRRAVRQRTEGDRRRRVRIVTGVCFLAVGFLCFLLIVFALLYFMKSALGINLLPDLHLWDSLGG